MQWTSVVVNWWEDIMRILFSILLLVSVAQGHVDPGLYKGTTPEGLQCSMLCHRTFFEGELKHPLTERVELTVNESRFVVQHPPVIDEKTKSAYFDHDQFKGVLPNAKGAMALVVKMNHQGGTEGPSEFYLISHEYRGNERSALHCQNLQLQRQ